jgi:addiction module HigA family antidote
MADKRLEPIHPGEILLEELMTPLGLSANALAREVGVPVTRISEIVRGRRGVSADTALRLARFFGTSPDLWLGLQAEYDLRVAKKSAGRSIERRIAAPREIRPGEYRPVLKSTSSVRERSATYGTVADRRKRRHAGGHAGHGPQERLRISPRRRGPGRGAP